MYGSRTKTIQSKLEQCKRAYQNAVKFKNELDSCRDELSDIQKKHDEKIRNQLTTKNEENEKLRNRIRQLQYERNRIQTESSKNQREAKLVLDL